MRLGKNVVILGGSGFIGREVAYELGRAGYRVTFLVRRPERYRDLSLLPNARVRGWSGDGAELEKRLKGQHVLVNLMVDQSDTLEAVAPERFAEYGQIIQKAAVRAEVRRVVHLSYVDADVNEGEGWARSLAELENAMHGINTAAATTIRVSLLIGEHDDTSSRYFAQLRKYLWAPVYRAKMRVQPLWVRDFARLTAKMIRDRASFGQRWNAVGGDTLTLEDMAQEIGEIARGQAPWVMDVCRLNARLMMALGPLAPASLHPAQLTTLQGDRVAEDADFEAQFGFRPTTVEVALASYVTPHDIRHRYNFYRKEAGRPLEELPKEWL